VIALAVTAEICATELSEAATAEMVEELSLYPDDVVLHALRRCRRELSRRLTLAAILERVDTGWPDPQEAWALCPHSEHDTTVWTQEIAEAFEAVRQMTDRVAARVAFLEIYRKKIASRRDSSEKPAWLVSLGHDVSSRESTIKAAVDKGRLTAGAAQVLCPSLRPAQDAHLLPGSTEADPDAPTPDEIGKLVTKLTGRKSF